MPALTQVKNAALASNATQTVDVPVLGMEILHIYTQVGSSGSPATATGDNNSYVTPYIPSGASGGQTTYLTGTQGLPTFLTSGPSLAGGVAACHRIFNVKGLEKVRINVQNTNASALPVQVDVFGA